MYHCKRNYWGDWNIFIFYCSLMQSYCETKICQISLILVHLTSYYFLSVPHLCCIFKNNGIWYICVHNYWYVIYIYICIYIFRIRSVKYVYYDNVLGFNKWHVYFFYKLCIVMIIYHDCIFGKQKTIYVRYSRGSITGLCSKHIYFQQGQHLKTYRMVPPVSGGMLTWVPVPLAMCHCGTKWGWNKTGDHNQLTDNGRTVKRKSASWCKGDVTPLLTYWGYVFCVLTHRYVVILIEF